MRIGIKKIITILAVLLLAISVTGCTDDNGNDGGESSSSSSTSSLDMDFVLIEAGSFDMGTSKYAYSQPVHEVRLENDYYIGKYEVTQAQWEAVMGSNPSANQGDDLPVESVSWEEVQEFIDKLNEMEGTTKYRLPTEAEWEYAAAAGTTTLYSFGEIDEDEGPFLKDYAWYQENSYENTHEVGQKLPNPWGLYDVHGNVWELVQDSWVDNYGSASEDGSAVDNGEGSLRVARGGSYSSKENALYTAYRKKQDPRDGDSAIGFRLVMDA
ncbi:formylglycine-generating enzyme family protein [Methanolobus bombayensis]|uniref:formylglycine-generating enzyme family protein n=1 Tax=Methanolobus bombayensis TaxID=38023 RepID=UPI001AEA3F5C|nr:formylglycine-generating enzyme family protein [Methanolobus bombayensis]MBP1909433.1 formylglycine-generating enzyme required for sulfatase activity [Methanolobus bombayensis]